MYADIEGTSTQTDLTGAKVSAISYFTYGSTHTESGSLTTDKRFTGQIYSPAAVDSTADGCAYG